MGAKMADPSLAGFIPLHSYDPNEKVFVQADGSLGIVWQVSQIFAEDMDTDQLAQTASALSSMLRRIPSEYSAQLIYHSSRDVRPEIQAWQDSGRRDGLFGPMASSRVTATEQLCLEDSQGQFVSRKVRVYLVLRRVPAWKAPGFSSKLRSLLRGAEVFFRHAQSEYHKQKPQLVEVARQIESAFQRIGAPFARLDSSGLLALFDSLLNPEASRLLRRPPKDDGRRLLREQLRLPSGQIHDRRGEITLDSYQHRVLSLVDVPTETFAGMLSLESHGRAALDAAPEMILSFNIRFPDQAKAKRLLKTKKRLVFSQLGSRDSQVEASATRNEIDAVLEEMFVQGEVALGCRVCFIVRDRNKDRLESQCNDLQAALASIGTESFKEQGRLAGSLLLQALPFGDIEETDEAAKRSRSMTSMNLAHILPLYGSFKGTPTPEMLLVNRRGQPSYFSFFDSETAPHGIIAGVTGSGKSVWAQNMILSSLRRGAQAFVLDRGHSYQKLSDLLGGQYVTFDINKPFSINPFPGTPDPETLTFLKDLVAELATHGEREPTPRETGIIVRAINESYWRKQASDEIVDLEDVRRSLEAIRHQDSVAGDLAMALELYVGKGPYAGFFLGPNQLSVENDLVVFELGDLALRKDIASAVLMAIIHNITRRCMGQLDRDKYLIIDEAWTLLKTRNTARFLENVYRTYRKYRTAALMLTQQVGDFQGTVGEAIRANAPNRVLLRQTPETVQSMERLMDLSPVQKALLQSVTSIKGLYSEALYATSSGEGVLRLAQDPLTYWITTTDPKDNTRLTRLIDKHDKRGHSDPIRAALMEAAIRGSGAQGPNGVVVYEPQPAGEATCA